MGFYAIAVAVVAVIFVALAIEDARTEQVPVRMAQLATAVAVVGLGLAGVVSSEWGRLVGAVLGAGVVTGTQLVPYLLQRRSSREWIGRADVRLAVPFGWTLGWFGLGFAIAGFAISLVVGLVVCAVTGRRQIPFVPCLAIGLWAGLGLAALYG